MNTIMKCGCAAQGKTADEKPICVTHLGIKAGADEVDTNPPKLEGRMAQCCYCKRTAPSSSKLPFFVHRSNMEYDDYYNGCLGWD